MFEIKPAGDKTMAICGPQSNLDPKEKGFSWRSQMFKISRITRFNWLHLYKVVPPSYYFVISPLTIDISSYITYKP